MAKRNKKGKGKEAEATVDNSEHGVRMTELIESQEAADAAEAAETETAVEASAVAKPARATADCESAKEESCSCRCRGKYHGKEHPKGWKDEAGCEPLNAEERKVAKKNALYSWRKAHPERVSAYMKQWREEKKKTEAENAVVEASETAAEGETESE